MGTHKAVSSFVSASSPSGIGLRLEGIHLRATADRNQYWQADLSYYNLRKLVHPSLLSS